SGEALHNIGSTYALGHQPPLAAVGRAHVFGTFALDPATCALSGLAHLVQQGGGLIVQVCRHTPRLALCHVVALTVRDRVQQLAPRPQALRQGSPLSTHTLTPQLATRGFRGAVRPSMIAMRTGRGMVGSITMSRRI